MSAFFLYSQANRAQVKADNPEASFGDVVSQSERRHGVVSYPLKNKECDDLFVIVFSLSLSLDILDIACYCVVHIVAVAYCERCGSTTRWFALASLPPFHPR